MIWILILFHFESYVFFLIYKSFDGNLYEFIKHKRVLFFISNKRSIFSFSLIYSDIWGSSHIPNIIGAQRFIQFTKDSTRITWLFLLKSKSNVNHIISQFCDMMKIQFGTYMKRFRIDNAKDFIDYTLSSFSNQKEIIHEPLSIHTPQQSRVVECKNSHIFATSWVFLF